MVNTSTPGDTGEMILEAIENPEIDSDDSDYAEPEVLPPSPSNREGLPGGNRIPDETREAIARAVLEEGKQLKEVAAEFRVHRNSVSSIAKEYFQEMADLADIQTLKRLESVSDRMLDRLADSVEDIPIQQLTTAYAILFDKQRIIRDKAGLNTGNKNLSIRVAWKGEDGNSGAVEVKTGE